MAGNIPFSFVAVVGCMPFDGACRMFQEPPAFFFYPPSFWPFARSSMGGFGRLKSFSTFSASFSKSAKSRHSRFPGMAEEALRAGEAREAHRASPNTGWNEAVWTWAAWAFLWGSTTLLSVGGFCAPQISPDTGEGEVTTGTGALLRGSILKGRKNYLAVVTVLFSSCSDVPFDSLTAQLGMYLCLGVFVLELEGKASWQGGRPPT